MAIHKLFAYMNLNQEESYEININYIPYTLASHKMMLVKSGLIVFLMQFVKS